jgi:hypothetical protein
MAFKKGLQEWPAIVPQRRDFDAAEVEAQEENGQWLTKPKIADAKYEDIQQLNEQIDKLMGVAFGNINHQIENFYNQTQDFSKMEPLELERLILSIQKVAYVASDIVAELYNDAYWSDRKQQDAYWRYYREPKSVKAKEDRQSYAMEQTRDARFYYYARYMVWRRLSVKLNALKDLQRTLEFSRQRSQKERW